MVESNKEKSIKTNILTIKGNIMIWAETLIQLSNVSYISTSRLQKKAFLLFSIMVLFGGILSWNINKFVSVLGVIFGILWILFWNEQNKKIESSTNLHIIMNSGNSFLFVFRDKNFLARVLTVLEMIIIEGGIGNQSISINIQNSEINGDLDILNDSKIE